MAEGYRVSLTRGALGAGQAVTIARSRITVSAGLGKGGVSYVYRTATGLTEGQMDGSFVLAADGQVHFLADADFAGPVIAMETLAVPVWFGTAPSLDAGADVAGAVATIAPAAVLGFAPGTRIATPRGERPVELLQPGQLVLTRDHGPQPVCRVDSRSLPAIDRFAPIRFRRGALPGLKSELVVAPGQRLMLRDYLAQLYFDEAEVMVAAADLENGETIRRELGSEVTYLEIGLARPEVIYAEGTLTESGVGAPRAKDPADDVLDTLYAILNDLPPQADPHRT